jgi:hypothetical protein
MLLMSRACTIQTILTCSHCRDAPMELTVPILGANDPLLTTGSLYTGLADLFIY